MNAPVALLLACGLAAWPEKAQSPISLPRVQVSLISQVQSPAREPGVLNEVLVREGSLVAAGDLLARIDDAHSKVQLEQAEIEWEIAKENAENEVNLRFAVKSRDLAQSELKRALVSLEEYKNSISSQEIDRLRLAAEKAELQIEQAKRDLRVAVLTRNLKQKQSGAAALDIARRQVRAPLDGMVVQILRQPGEWVGPGEPVVRILRLDRLRVEGFLPASKHGAEVLGAAVVLSVDLPGRPAQQFAGKVVFVSPEVEPVTGHFRLWAEVENRELLLRPGLQGALEITPRPVPVAAARGGE